MMLNHSRILGAISLSLLMIGCSSTPTYKDDREPVKADMARYKTYKWVDQPASQWLRLSNPNINYLTAPVKINQQPQVEAEVREAIDRDLQSQGYHPVENGTPDFFVSFYARTKDMDWVSTWTGSAPGVGEVPVVMYPGWSRPDTYQYRDGSVMLVFYDAKSRSPSWSGMVLGTQSGQLKPHDEIAEGFSKIIEDFRKSA